MEVKENPMNPEQAQLDAAIKKAIGARVVADGGIALRIRCVAYPESSAHYADAVVVSATSLVLSIDGVADTTFRGATGTLLFSAYTTLGALVDEINSSSNWNAEIVAGLRTDAINGSELLARSTSTFRMFEETDLHFDSSDSGVYGISFLLQSGIAFEKDADVLVKHRVGVKRVKWLCNTASGAVVTLACYELEPGHAASIGTLVADSAADNTEGDTGAADEPIAHAGYGNDILVRIVSTEWVDTAAYLDVMGVRE